MSDASNDAASQAGQVLTTHQLEDVLEYDVLRPTHMGPEDIGPVLLALPPGDQSRAMVDLVQDLYWREEALRLGWTVISPVAPDGHGFQGEHLLPLQVLVEHIQSSYRIEGGKLHLAGVSNGGRSAFELALEQPDLFASLSVLPGVPSVEGFKHLNKLVKLPLAMYVGGDDTGWLDSMQRTAKILSELQAPPLRFTVYPGEGHTPKSLGGKTIFNTLEAFRVRDVLQDFHDAASKADARRYFDHFAENAIFIGTDASERWTKAAFRAFAEPYFSKGRGWTYLATERHTFVSEDGQSAWFDELLDNESYGITRGTGVLQRGPDARWRLAQYHLTIPVPNNLATQLVALIRAEPK